MSRARTILAVVLIAVLVGYQHFVMERMPEKIEEDRTTRIENLPATAAVPTFLASLFLGSFRALAIDLFWIQLQNLRKERRFFEAQQVMELISWLQPRNPEVWALLGWDGMYNIPEGGIEDAEKKWHWIRYGITKLHEGSVWNPENPYLCYELGRVLWHKVSWRENGWFDMALITRIEQDDELQDLLQEKKHEKDMSPFVLGAHWLQKARRLIEAVPTEERFSRATTQMGLVLHPDTMDGLTYHYHFMEAMYQWGLGNRGAALEHLQKASRGARLMREKYGQDRTGPIHASRARLYDRLPPVIEIGEKLVGLDLESEEARGLREEALRLLEEAMIEANSNIENGYILARLTFLKRQLSAHNQENADAFEFNDGMNFASTLSFGEGYMVNLGPFLTDVDTYLIWIPPPPAGKEAPPRTITVTVFSKGDVPMRVRASNHAGEQLLETEIQEDERRTIEFQAKDHGAYFLEVTARDLSPEKAPPSRYYIQWLGTEPPLEDR